MKVAGSESKRMTTRVSSESPRDASRSPGSVPRPERDGTVVSTTTASMVMFWTSPPIGGHRTAQTPELSRFSEHDNIETNKAAVASNRGRIDGSFTTLFHVKGSARKRREAARGASTLLPFPRACNWKL